MFQSKKDIAKERLLDAILSGRYEPGTYLRQNDIAADLNLSSTPVREAFSELQVEGLLVHESHRGFRVAQLHRRRVEQIYATRKIVEPAAARLAVANMTASAAAELSDLLDDMQRQRAAGDFAKMMVSNDNFHRTLFLLSGNEILVELIERLWNSFPRFLPWTLAGRQETSLAEHARIVSAVNSGDADKLAAAYEAHLDNARDLFLAYLVTDDNGTASPGQAEQ